MKKPAPRSQSTLPPEQYHSQLKRDVELLVPTVMMNLIHEALPKAGYVVERKDIVELCGRAMRDSVEDMDQIYMAIVAGKAADEASAILRASNADSVPSLWVAVAHFILALGNRGVLVNKDIALVAAAIETELLVEEDKWGGERVVKPLAEKMDNEARRRGLFLGEMKLAS